MKNLVFAAILLSASLATTASGQVKSVAAANKQPASKTVAANQTPNQIASNATRSRVLGPEQKSAAAGSIVSSGALQAQTRSDFNNHASVVRFRRANTSSAAPAEGADKLTPKTTTSIATVPSDLKPAITAPSLANTPTAVNTSIASASTQVYRVGERDVLDIQLADNLGRNSTLFTVLEGGMLEYPLAGGPIAVAGMTAPEIAALLRQRIKIFDNPTVTVTVRDYASHAVSITGFVAAPGTKILRREAVPLYTVLAEALMLPDAARATITRPGERAPITVDLKNADLSAALIVPGDAIKVSGLPALPTEFYFVGGEIGAPGQKPFHAGLTLTQAILASGGTSPSAGSKVKVSRQGTDGRLSTEEYNLRKIQAGKTPDPVLQNGDRVEVTAAN